MSDRDDEALLRQIAKGDSKAFESLLRAHKRAVFGLAYHLTGSKMTAEDISQETWIRVVKNAESFKGESARAWILTIARNLSLNELRRGKWEAELPPEDEGRLVSDAFSFDELMQTESDLKRVQSALTRLPDRQRVALVLFLSEERTYAQIGAELELDVNAVKALLFRARENLKKMMAEAS